jgi:16S rRNA (cytosine1402-N4)-methyltransferase
MLIENADEPYAAQIAANVMKWRYMGKPIQTTTNFRDCIAEALSFLPKHEQKESVKKSCQRSFQALRIDVNSEFDVLYAFLEKLPSVLNPGGKVAVLTFHSGEDRLVKKGFQAFYRMGIYSDVAREVIRPTAEECIKNSRAKSTKMRWAIRSDLEE